MLTIEYCIQQVPKTKKIQLSVTRNSLVMPKPASRRRNKDKLLSKSQNGRGKGDMLGSHSTCKLACYRSK